MRQIPVFIGDRQKVALGRVAGVVKNGVDPTMSRQRQIDH